MGQSSLLTPWEQGSSEPQSRERERLRYTV
jgi:hypothetical protein